MMLLDFKKKLLVAVCCLLVIKDSKFVAIARWSVFFFSLFLSPPSGEMNGMSPFPTSDNKIPAVAAAKTT